MTKTYYGANSVMGKNFSYDSECWLAYSFDTKEELESWIAKKPENRERVTKATAYKILGMNSHLRVIREPGGQLWTAPLR